jgi:hypothetical protein
MRLVGVHELKKMKENRAPGAHAVGANISHSSPRSTPQNSTHQNMGSKPAGTAMTKKMGR